MTDNIPTIRISDFTVYPTARYVTDGPKSAQEFFDEILESFLDENQDKNIVIDFDNTWGYASSFKNEVAVRLAEKYPGVESNTLRERISLISDDEPGLVDRFWEEYEEAQDEMEN